LTQNCELCTSYKRAKISLNKSQGSDKRRKGKKEAKIKKSREDILSGSPDTKTKETAGSVLQILAERD
jgi:hypothetical protein